MPTSPHLFLLFGFTLVILAVIILPTKLLLPAQPMDPDYYNVGWLFSPVIGSWGLFSAAFGLIQLSWKKLKIQVFLLPIFALALAIMMFTISVVASLGSSLIHTARMDVQLFWFSYAVLTVIPSIIVTALTAMQLRKKEKGPVFVGKKLRVAAFAASVAVPLLYSVVLYYSLALPRPV